MLTYATQRACRAQQLLLRAPLRVANCCKLHLRAQRASVRILTEHTSAYVSIRVANCCKLHLRAQRASVSILTEHTSAYVSMRVANCCQLHLRAQLVLQVSRLINLIYLSK
jgi:hypothetical protein